MKPNIHLYEFFQKAFDFFNRELYDNSLPPCIFTLQREKKVMGYFSKNRWIGSNNKKKINEISLNPMFFATKKPLEFYQTLVHEMAHLWQHEHGKPSRAGYHNKEWAEKMVSIGLIPTRTGAIGGKMTGQSVLDYPDKDGLFYQKCIEFIKAEMKIPYFDVFIKENLVNQTEEIYNNPIEQLINTPFNSNIEIMEELTIKQSNKTKTKYHCNNCNYNIWGKPNLSIICGDCQEEYQSI